MIDFYTDNTPATKLNDILHRGLWRTLCSAIYMLLTFLYKIIFTISMTDFLSGQKIMDFYSRVQTILGIVITFRLLVVLLNGIVNPDTFVDQKNGFGNVISRVIISLVLLVSIIPISIPNASNSFEKNINNNGILFGVLYDFQYRILDNNTMAKLILGDENDELTALSDDSAADYFATSLLKMFIHINLKPVAARVKCGTSSDNRDITSCKENWMVQKLDDNLIKLYTNEDKIDTTEDLLELTNLDYSGTPDDVEVNEDEDTSVAWYEFDKKLKNYISSLFNSTDKYWFSFHGLFATIFGVVAVLMLLSICMELAKRTIKMAVLRLIAPIPIISYISTKSDNGMLQSWTKSLTAVYVDLFIRLGMIYFVCFAIQEIMETGISLPSTDSMVQIFSTLFIVLALLFFAKEAPKFITDALGLKDTGSFKGMFSGVGELAAAGGIAASTIGHATSNARTIHDENKDKIEELKAAGLTEDQAKRKSRVSRLANYAGGALNVGAGTFGAMSAAVKADKDKLGAAMKYRNQAMQTRAEGSTALGRFANEAKGMVTGRTIAEDYEKSEKNLQSAQEKVSAYQSAIDSRDSARRNLESAQDMQKETWKKAALKTDMKQRFSTRFGEVDATYEEMMEARSHADSRGNFELKGLALNTGDYTQSQIEDMYLGAVRGNETYRRQVDNDDSVRTATTRVQNAQQTLTRTENNLSNAQSDANKALKKVESGAGIKKGSIPSEVDETSVAGVSRQIAEVQKSVKDDIHRKRVQPPKQ